MIYCTSLKNEKKLFKDASSTPLPFFTCVAEKNLATVRINSLVVDVNGEG
jgi:hypothetical protein